MIEYKYNKMTINIINNIIIKNIIYVIIENDENRQT